MTNARPILFSAPMVKAILAGTKSQTRRTVKLPPELRGLSSDDIVIPEISPERVVQWCKVKTDGGAVWTQTELKCPFRVGMRLWVKEAWCPATGGDGGIAWNPDGNTYHVHYRADGTQVVALDDDGARKYLKDGRREASPWKSSLFMPRCASRLTLEVTQVRVERVQDISEEDARAEGFDAETCEEVLRAASRDITPEEAYCAESEKGVENEGWLCRDCADKYRGKHGYLCWGCTPEDDGPAFCDKCYKPLLISLSKYGIERELRIEDDPKGKEPKYFPCKGNDAAIAAMIAGGIGDLRDEHLGRLAQIGFATKWNEINGAESWDANPFVWVVGFRRVEQKEGAP